MKVKILKHCVSGLTRTAYRAGDIVDITEGEYLTIPLGCTEVIMPEAQKRTAENVNVKTRTKRTKK